MAITINGSGTIGGVSVGGLPDGIVDTDMLASNAVTSALLPAGSVVQIVSAAFNVTETTTSTSYQSSSMTLAIQKKATNNKIIVITSGGHSYNTDFSNGCLSTICQEGGSSTFTASTTYSSGNDPASSASFGMQQVYNNANINTAPHSKTWLFASTGYEFEAYRCFYKSRVAGRTANYLENGNFVTMTAMEIAA